MTFLRRFLFPPVVNNARFGSLLRNNNARYQDMAHSAVGNTPQYTVLRFDEIFSNPKFCKYKKHFLESFVQHFLTMQVPLFFINYQIPTYLHY